MYLPMFAQSIWGGVMGVGIVLALMLLLGALYMFVKLYQKVDQGTALVRNGMGVAVLPVLCVDPRDHDVAIHPIVPAIPSRVISIAWRAGRTLSPIAERFIQLAIEAGARVGERI